VLGIEERLSVHALLKAARQVRVLLTPGLAASDAYFFLSSFFHSVSCSCIHSSTRLLACSLRLMHSPRNASHTASSTDRVILVFMLPYAYASLRLLSIDRHNARIRHDRRLGRGLPFTRGCGLTAVSGSPSGSCWRTFLERGVEEIGGVKSFKVQNFAL
jgi:hypothetical protein